MPAVLKEKIIDMVPRPETFAADRLTMATDMWLATELQLAPGSASLTTFDQ
jgi:hypothetical protein